MCTAILKWITLADVVLLIASSNVFSMVFFGLILIICCILCMISAEINRKNLYYKSCNYRPSDKNDFSGLK